jgi:hypothetical protein
MCISSSLQGKFLLRSVRPFKWASPYPTSQVLPRAHPPRPIIIKLVVVLVVVVVVVVAVVVIVVAAVIAGAFKRKIYIMAYRPVATQQSASTTTELPLEVKSSTRSVQSGYKEDN